MSTNLVAIWAYDYLVVNGVRKHYAKKKRAARSKSIVSSANIVSNGDIEKKQEKTGNTEDFGKEFNL
jgi:hypothetical protein